MILIRDRFPALLLCSVAAGLVGCAGSVPIQRAEVEDLTQAFNFWSDRGLYQRPDLQEALSLIAAEADAQPRFPDMAAHARELTRLLAPFNRVFVEIEGREEVQTSEDFVNGVQRSRFQWKVREGLLEEPRIELQGPRAVVRMSKFHLEPDRQDGAYVYDAALFVRRVSSALLVTEARLTYRKATELEAERMKELPPCSPPAGLDLASLVATPERLIESLDRMPPRRPQEGEVQGWLRKLEAKQDRPTQRALAAFNIGSFGPHAAAAVPALIAALDDESPAVRRAAAEALGRIGPAARPALPKLREKLEDSSGDVRWQAQHSIERLEAKAAVDG